MSRELEPPLRRRRALLALTAPLAAVIATAIGPTLFEGESGGTTAAFATKTLWDGNQREADGINPFIQEFERIEAWGVWNDLENTEAIANALRADLLAFATNDPSRFMGLQGRKALIYLSTWEVANNSSVQWRRDRSPVLSAWIWVGFGGLLALACAGLVAVGRRWRAHILPLGWALTWSASFVAILVAGRYRLPAATVMAVYAGIGAVAIVDAARCGALRRLALLLCALGVATLVTTLDPLDLRNYKIASVVELEAQVLERAGDVAGAEAHYRGAVELARFGPELESALGLFLLRQGRAEEGFAAMARAADRDPDDADLRKDLGGSLRDGGRALDAVPVLVEAAALDPNDAGTAYNLGLALADVGDLAGADVALTRSLALGGEPGSILLERGVVRARQGRWDEAEPDLRAAVDEIPDHCSPVANLGLLLEKTGRGAEAAELYGRCPDDPVCARRLERILAGTE
jgi:tetratricopeptide (TPR) repeat protein